MLVEKKVKDLKKSKDDSKENFDLSDIEKNSQDGFLLGIMGAMPETQSFESDLCSFDGSMPTIKEATANLQAVCIDKMEPNISVEQPPAPPPPSAAPPIEKDNEISSCVVCDKKFKSKSCMNKHLRSVHAGLLINSIEFVLIENNEIDFVLFCFFSSNIERCKTFHIKSWPQKFHQTILPERKPIVYYAYRFAGKSNDRQSIGIETQWTK